MPVTRHRKKDLQVISRIAGMPADEVEETIKEEQKVTRLPKKYDNTAQKSLIDRMLEKIPEMVDRTHDAQSFQQLTNSMAQLIRLRQEVEEKNKDGVDADDPMKMDASASKARDKILSFGERAANTDEE